MALELPRQSVCKGCVVGGSKVRGLVWERVRGRVTERWGNQNIRALWAMRGPWSLY